jgi:pimeloyl-ACP methyl ester carboxylesterase
VTRIADKCNAEVSGSGHDYLVLAHGFGADKSIWGPLMPLLAPYYRVVRYDLACAGSADPSLFDIRRHKSLDGYAEDLLGLLVELGIERCTFVGHSMSAMAGILAATMKPAFFERLVLIGASPRYIEGPGYASGFDQAEMARMLDAITRDFDNWSLSFASVVVARPIDDPATQTFLGSLRRMRPDIALATWQAIQTSDYRDVLTACRVPAVILQTRNDPAVPMSVAEFLHSRLAGSILEILDIKGHIPQIIAPAVVAESLRLKLPALAQRAHALD